MRGGEGDFFESACWAEFARYVWAGLEIIIFFLNLTAIICVGISTAQVRQFS